MTLAASVAIARGLGWLSRRSGRGGGTSAPGKVLLRLHPSAIQLLSERLPEGTLVVSATNGKTTTARLIGAVVAAQGWPAIQNFAGANLLSGIATALIPDAGTRQAPEIGIFEVDELALPEVAARLRPRVMVLMNLFRDQLDRSGELERIAERWSAMIAGLPADTRLVANADDPSIAALAGDRPGTIWFGIDDPRMALAEVPHAADATRCRRCHTPLRYGRVVLGHMGDWECPGCGWSRPDRDVGVTEATLDGTSGVSLEISTPEGVVHAELAVPGVHNVYNAAAALGAAVALGIPAGRAAAALAAADAAFGRAERVRVGSHDLLILLAKNPAGANTTVHTVMLDPEPLHLLVALNDQTADGHDVSWIWDADYEPLLERLAGVVCTGDRAYDMALRFAYAGCPRDRITVIPDVSAALDHALADLPEGRTLYALPTYTAMLRLRQVLVQRGAAQEFWRDR
ncbi:MAG: DUF1727 domain-containing protein [Actinobacteria bacterium]|nr:DUF1727 domain-containing protein [Actinomycetota bacterium]